MNRHIPTIPASLVAPVCRAAAGRLFNRACLPAWRIFVGVPKGLLLALVLANLCCVEGVLGQNVSATWGANNNSAWYTGSNWVGNSYPGSQGAAASNTNIATFTSAFTGTTVGINMNPNSLNLGAISIDNTRTTALNIGNSSGTAGVLRLYGATVNSVANTILRNNSSGLLTLQASQSGTMGVVLSNATDNIIDIDGSGGITISSILSNSSGNRNLTKTGSGSGVLTLSGTNTYSGVTTINAGVLSVGTIGNGGVAGNLGQATNAAANLVLGGGTLRYTGATASSDRAFTLTTGTSSFIEITDAGSVLTHSGGSASTTGALAKIGPGTLIFSGVTNYSGGTTITEGTLALGTAGVINNSGVMVLNGGTLSTGLTTGFGEQLGTLDLNASSMISLGTGSHSLLFAASNAVGWTGGSILTITGWTGGYDGLASATGGRIFVGNTSGGLTAAQVAQIRFFNGTDNFPAAILSTGEIVPYTPAAPTNLSYSTPNYFGTGAAISALNPTVTGELITYSISPALPTGLSLNTSTGVISGTPTVVTALATYTVTATNTGGSTTFDIAISVGNNRYAVANNGNWNVTSTWSTSSGGSSGASVPVAGDIVYIGEGANNRTVTIPTNYAGTCGNIIMGNQSDNTVATLNFASGSSTLVVGGDLVMNRPNANAVSTIGLGAGVLTVNKNFELSQHSSSANNAGRVNSITISTGTLTVGGDLIYGAEALEQSQIVFSGSGNLNIAGSFTLSNNLGTLTPSSGTVNFNGTVAQTIPIGVSSVTYANLKINNTSSSGATLGAAISVSNVTGDITIGDINTGSLLNTNNLAITRGNSEIITVAAGSVLNAGTSLVTFGTGGSAVINGTFKSTNSTGAFLFGTTGSATINGLFQTANTNGFSNAASTAIRNTNSPTITLGSNSTIEYNAAGNQTVTARTYSNLALSNSGNKTIGNGTVVSSNLSISNTAKALLTTGGTSTALTLTLGGVNQVTGSWGSTGSAATNKNDTWFVAANSGIINVNTGCTAGTWLGTTSTDWNTASNWCGGIPTATTDVTIPSAPSNQPVIGAAGGLCRNLTIASSASLTITGANTLAVAGNWSNSGTFTPNTSTVSFTAAAGTQTLNNGSSSFYNLTHSGAGSLQLATNALTVSNSFNNSGGGTVNLAGLAPTLGDLQGTGTITSSVAGAVTLSAGGNNASTTFSGIIQNGSGTVAVTKTGTGTWTLSGANTYSGLTTISAGVLNIQHNTALGSSAAGTSVANGACLELQGNITVGDEALSIAGVGPSGNAALDNVSGNNTWGGTITLTNNAAVRNQAGNFTINNASAFVLAGFELTLGGNTSGGVGLVSGVISSTGSGNLRKVTAAGTWTLSAANTFTGGVQLAAGTLNINHAQALGTVAGTFTIGGVGNTVTFDNTSGAPITTLNYPMAWNDDFTFAGSNALNLGTGAATLEENRQITVDASTLTVGGTINHNTLNLTKAGAGVLSFGSQSVTLKDLNLNAGTLTATSGTLNLAGNYSNSGTFTHNGGTVNINGGSAQTLGGSAASTFNNLTIANTSGGVSLTKNQTVAGNLTLTSGILSTDATNILAVTNTATSAVSAGSTTKFINGPLRWSLSTGAYVFPVGKSGGNYFPFTLTTSAASAPVVTIEAFAADAGAGATFDATLTSISHTEYWKADLNSGTFTGKVSLTRIAALTTEDVIGKSTAQGGTYTSIGGTASSPSILNSNDISSFSYFVMATGAKDCPVTTAVTPGADQTVCEGVATNQLTAVVTTSGGTGTPVIQYQWYYNTNTTNSNTVSGATLVSGATASTYTPLSGPAEAGSTRYYFCVGYASNNGCGQSNTTQTQASNTVNVIVAVAPTANAGAALTAFCQGGSSAALGGSVGGSATGGTWSDGGVGGTFSPSATDLNATWTPPGAYSGTATLTLTTDGGSPCTPATASKTQVVHPRPTANTCNPVGDYCYSNAGSIDVKASGGTAPYNVTWTPAHGMTQPAVIAASGGTITVTGLHANTPYTFTVTDANLCTAQ